MITDQHQACAPGLDKLWRYGYDAATLVALMDVFRSVFQRHLTNEIGTLLMLEKGCDSGAMLKMWCAVGKAVGTRPNFIDKVLPLALGLSDRTGEGDILDFHLSPGFCCISCIAGFRGSMQVLGYSARRTCCPKPRELWFVGSLNVCCVEACLIDCYLRNSGLYVHESCCLGNERHPLTYVECRRFWYGPST
jgi:hypothetical protein